MSLINSVVALFIAGTALWLIDRYSPRASSIKLMLNAVVVIAIGVWVLQSTGLLAPITSNRFPR
jgi:predicted membrane protein